MKLIGIKLKMWKILRETALIRDGRKCQLCGVTESLQVDHCFSRNNSILFFELKNLTTLCNVCHSRKTHKWFGTEKRVDKLVENREGEKWFTWAEKESRKLFHWNQYLLENKFEYIKDEHEKIKHEKE